MKKLQQFDIFSFSFSRLKNNNFNINITLDQAKSNDEIIQLADNEVLRAIRRITNHPYSKDILDSLTLQRKDIIKAESSYDNKQKISEINGLINQQLFIPEYVSITTDKKTDYYKIGKNGFLINNVKYVRLLCGAGHARTNRTMFVSSKIYGQINSILKNGANKAKLVYAKYNAYYSLTSSATYEVSKPRVCVVPDKLIKMTKHVDFVTEDSYQDIVTECDKELEFNLWDGMGLISPEFANQWCKDIELDYLPSAFLIRCAFIKGLVCVFDFLKFANDVAHKYIIKDLYGFEHDVRDIDIIITQSQFKLWNCYDNWAHYEACLRKSGIQWGISKVTPKRDKDFIRTNYQFLQVLNLKDEDIEELCKPTVNWIKGVSGGDIQQMKLYLLGKLAKENGQDKIYENVQDDFLKALMLDENLIKDNYIKNRIVSSLNKRIKESYIGKLLVRGNFQTMINDPYALCEYIFGLEIKGLLKEFEHYSDYWNNRGVKEVAAMRSPLTWQSEVNLLHLQNTPNTNEWYKYITSGIIFNVWGYDNMIHAG